MRRRAATSASREIIRVDRLEPHGREAPGAVSQRASASENVDGEVVGRLARREGVEDPAGLPTGSAPRAGHEERRVHRARDLGRVPPEDPLVGARQPVFGKDADRLEERGPHLVVEERGREALGTGAPRNPPDRREEPGVEGGLRAHSPTVRKAA